MKSNPALGRIHFSGSDIAANVTIKHKNKKLTIEHNNTKLINVAIEQSHYNLYVFNFS